MKRKEKRAKKVEKIIRLTWDSLKSHLAWCYKKKVKKNGGQKFHNKCVKEYCKTLSTTAKLY